jgi:hypothetical protein
MSHLPNPPALKSLNVGYRPPRMSRQGRGRGRLPTHHPAVPGVPADAEPSADRRRTEELLAARYRVLVALRYLRASRYRLGVAVHAVTATGNR